jgi:hypothetical protein
MTVSFESGRDVKVGVAHALFEVPQGMVDRISVTPDGQRFVMIQPEPEQIKPPEIVIVPRFLDDISTRLTLKQPR